MSDNIQSKKKKIIEVILNFLGVILLIFLIIICVNSIVNILGPSMIIPSLAKNQKNIKSNGCLRYAKQGKHNVTMFYLNQRGPIYLRNITMKEFPFTRKWNSYDSVFFMEFKHKYTIKCFKVKYIHHEYFGEYIYDVE